MKTYQQNGNDSLLTINQKTLKKVLLKNVVLLKGNINYTTFYLESGKEKVVARTLKFFGYYLETRGFLVIGAKGGQIGIKSFYRHTLIL